MNELIERIKSAIAKYRLTFGNELDLQNQLVEIFHAHAITFEREFVLSPQDRPDFYIKPFAVEVKVGGSIESHLRQLQRYNSHPAVSGTILICTKPFQFMMPETLSKKPVAAINVGGKRL